MTVKRFLAILNKLFPTGVHKQVKVVIVVFRFFRTQLSFSLVNAIIIPHFYLFVKFFLQEHCFVSSNLVKRSLSFIKIVFICSTTSWNFFSVTTIYLPHLSFNNFFFTCNLTFFQYKFCKFCTALKLFINFIGATFSLYSKSTSLRIQR